MALNDFEKWIAHEALGYLWDDDASPEVGMGMPQYQAIDYAFEEFKKSATLFAGGYDFALMQVNRDNIERYVADHRR